MGRKKNCTKKRLENLQIANLKKKSYQNTIKKLHSKISTLEKNIEQIKEKNTQQNIFKVRSKQNSINSELRRSISIKDE